MSSIPATTSGSRGENFWTDVRRIAPLAWPVIIGQIAVLAFHTSWFGFLVKGEPVLLIEDGKIQRQGMRRGSVSAHDLAHTAAYLDTYYPDLAAIAGTRDVAIPATPTHKAFNPHNLNRLLWTYPGATGLKTGLTDSAGGCMLATATRGDRHLIAVVLNATLHSTDDATALLNYGFSVNPSRGFGPLAA